VGGLPTVTFEEAAMTRLESSAWPLAAGAACVFALAVVLGGLPWQAGFVVVAGVVACWAWQSPPVTGAAIGGIAWLCVTGFDVHRSGDIRITGSEDALRAAVLILAGALVASVHAVAEVRRVRSAAGHDTPRDATPLRRRIPRRPGAARIERPLPVHQTKGIE
jgi:hypothetical protein